MINTGPDDTPAPTFNAGDQVYVTTTRTIRRAAITRTTKTQAIVEYGKSEIRYDRNTGRQIGAGIWDAAYIVHPSPVQDKRYSERLVHDAASTLARAIQQGNPEEIRAAYARRDERSKRNEEL